MKKSSIEKKLKSYITRKYGKIKISTPITKMTKIERHSHCKMCKAVISLKKSFVYTSMSSYLTNNSDLIICEPCAKREHGNKNRYRWKDLIEDLDKK